MSIPIVLHPYLFAVAPPLILLTHNINKAGIEVIFVPCVLSLAGACILQLLLTRIIRVDREKAALLVSYCVFMFFAYGDFEHTMRLNHIGGASILDGRQSYVVWLVAAVVGAAALLRMRRDIVRKLTRPLNATSTCLVIVTLVLIAVQVIHGSSPTSRPPVAGPSTDRWHHLRLSSVSKEKSELPDIYYLILDSYGGQSTLEELYGLDNSGFYQFLSRKGFYIAEASNANYPCTLESLPSALNMSYLDFLGDQSSPKKHHYKDLVSRMADNEVFRIVKSMGYTVVVISGYGFTRSPFEESAYASSAVDRREECGDGEAMQFGDLLIRRSLLWPLRWYLSAPRWRDHHRCLLSKLRDSCRLPGPKLVFFHVMLPHPPFVFGSDGTPVFDGLLQFDSHEVWSHKEGYKNQVRFINREMEKILDRILETASTKPIIVLQGDHGPMSHGMKHFSDRKAEALKERTRILNAYHVPENVRDMLYPWITPVNSFRLILRQRFGVACELLEDKIFDYWPPYQFQYREITDIVCPECGPKTAAESRDLGSHEGL